MSKGQGKRSWASDDLAIGVVLGTVAWAHELVFSFVPWHDASQMGTDGVDAKVLDSTVSGDEICRVALKALHETVVTSWMSSFPSIELDIVSESVFGYETASATASTGWIEEVEETETQLADGQSNRTEQDEVHEITFVHIRNHLSFSRTSGFGRLERSLASWWSLLRPEPVLGGSSS